MTEYRAFVVVGAVLAMLFTATAAAVWLRPDPPRDVMSSRIMSDEELRAITQPTRGWTAEQWADACKPEPDDPPERLRGCERVYAVMCPPHCEWVAELERVSIEDWRGVRRVQ